LITIIITITEPIASSKNHASIVNIKPRGSFDNHTTGILQLVLPKSLQELQVVKRQKAEAVEKEVGNAIVCGKL